MDVEKLFGVYGGVICGNNRWLLDIDMIMVALRLLGFEAKTERKRSGSGAGTPMRNR